MSDDKLMGKYIKYLSKRYIIEEEYLKDLFIQLKTFIIYWFDKKMNANIQYIEYKGNGIVEFYSDKEFTKDEKSIISLELNLQYQYHTTLNNVFLYGWKWDDNDG